MYRAVLEEAERDGSYYESKPFVKGLHKDRCQLETHLLVSRSNRLRSPPQARCHDSSQWPEGLAVCCLQLTTPRGRTVTGNHRYLHILILHSTKVLKLNQFIWIQQVFAWNTVRGRISKLPSSQSWCNWNCSTQLTLYENSKITGFPPTCKTLLYPNSMAVLSHNQYIPLQQITFESLL